MSSERDIVERLREQAKHAEKDHDTRLFLDIVNAIDDIKTLRKEVNAWRRNNAIVDPHRHDVDFINTVLPAIGATDAAGALGKEASDGK